jgi:hypothetical protein
MVRVVVRVVVRVRVRVRVRHLSHAGDRTQLGLWLGLWLVLGLGLEFELGLGLGIYSNTGGDTYLYSVSHRILVGQSCGNITSNTANSRYSLTGVTRPQYKS